MSKSSNLSIFAGSTAVVALLLSLAAYVLFSGRRIERSTFAIENDSVPGLIDGHTIRSAYSEGFVCALLMNRDIPDETRRSLAARTGELDRTAEQAADDYGRTILINPPLDSANFQKVTAARDEFLHERGRFTELANAGRFAEANAVMQDTLLPAYDALMAACDTLVIYNNSTGLAYSSNVASTVRQLRWVVVAVVILAVVTAGFVAAHITRQLRMIRELRDSEAKFSTAFENSPRAMGIARRSDGLMLEANPAMARTLGLKREQIVGKTATELGVWKSDEERREIFRQFDAGAVLRDLPRVVRNTDGSERTILVTMAPLELKGVDCVLSITQDITELVGIQKALNQTIAEFRAIFDNAPTGMALVEPSGRIVRWNRGLERFLGYDAEELATKTIRDVTFADDVTLDMDRFEMLVAGRIDAYQIDKRYVRKDGAVVWGRLSASVVLDSDGKLAFVVGLVDDINDQKKSEAALAAAVEREEGLQEQLYVAQKLEALGLLAGGVAHDFNNMIAATLLYIDLIRDEPGLSKECLDTLADLKETVRRAAGLTRQLLLFSRREPAHRESVDLNGLAANVVKMLSRLIGSHITLQHTPAEEPLWVHADAGMIDQVVMNLVVNARDAMPRGGKIELNLSEVAFDSAATKGNRSRREGRFARIEVCDNGTGMSKETVARIFEPFFTTKDAGKGTGLGLSTALGIIQQHEGWVEVDSIEGKGSSFVVFLPIDTSQNSHVEAVTPHERAGKSGGETILLAEDNLQLRAVTARILKQHGYCVFEASSGVEARQFLDEHEEPVDLLLTDVVMPGGMFGHDLAASVRADGRATRIILMSAHNTMVDREAIELAGGVYLPKPFDTATLLDIVRRTLDGQAPSVR